MIRDAPRHLELRVCICDWLCEKACCFESQMRPPKRRLSLSTGCTCTRTATSASPNQTPERLSPNPKINNKTPEPHTNTSEYPIAWAKATSHMLSEWEMRKERMISARSTRLFLAVVFHHCHGGNLHCTKCSVLEKAAKRGTTKATSNMGLF